MTEPADVQPPADQQGTRSELTLRVLAALVLVPIVLLAVWAGGFWFALLVAVGKQHCRRVASCAGCPLEHLEHQEQICARK